MAKTTKKNSKEGLQIGYQMNVYKQDPTVKDIGIRRVLITNKVLKGPEDYLIKMIPTGVEYEIEEEDFLIDLDANKIWHSEARIRAFDRVHTFAACRMVLTMYQQAFFRLGSLKTKGRSKILKPEDRVKGKGQYDFLKKWGKQLEVNPHEYRNVITAKYSTGDVSIGFGYKEYKNIYTCRSFDVIAHEVGHAVLHAIWDRQTVYNSDESVALSEAFCDLTVLFSILSQLDMCDTAIVLSKGKLLDPNFLKQIAEEFGTAKNVTENGRKLLFLRNLGQKKYYDKVDHEERYAFSQVLSSAIYRFIVDVFNDYSAPERYDPAETLFRVARFITGTTLGAYYLVAKDTKDVTFAQIGKKMIFLLTNMRSSNNIGRIKDRKRWAELLKEKLKENRIPLDE